MVRASAKGEKNAYQPLLIATIATGLSIATFYPGIRGSHRRRDRGRCDRCCGRRAPGVAVGAILGTAISTNVYFDGPRYAYGPAPYYGERYACAVPVSAPPPAYASPPAYAHTTPLGPAPVRARSAPGRARALDPNSPVYGPRVVSRGLHMFTVRANTTATVPATTPGAMRAPTIPGIARRDAQRLSGAVTRAVFSRRRGFGCTSGGA